MIELTDKIKSEVKSLVDESESHLDFWTKFCEYLYMTGFENGLSVGQNLPEKATEISENFGYVIETKNEQNIIIVERICDYSDCMTVIGNVWESEG